MTRAERGSLFARQLGFAVDVQRRGLVCLYPGFFTAAVEDVVGGVVHQPGAQRLGFFGDGGNAGGVEQLGEVALALGFIHRGMRGGVDDHVRLQQTHGLGHAFRIAEVTAVIGRVKIHRRDTTQRQQRALQFPAYLAIFAEQQNMHQLRS